jgi:hypothetical protein
MAVQITLAKLGLTKLHLNPSGWAGAELEIEDVVVSSVGQGETLSGAANANEVAEPMPELPDDNRTRVETRVTKNQK